MIYLDNAATTRTSPEVVEAMLPYFSEYYGNAGSIYGLGSKSKRALIMARETIAGTIGAQANEIYFTAGGTESDNWALKAVYESCQNRGRHIITTKIEHHAVLHTCKYLEERGARITYLDVDENGMIDPEQLKKAIRSDTVLISVMYANNEIGTIEPIEKIGEIADEHGILFHTDAVQAYGHLPVDVEKMHIDLLSASGHKFNGPKGVGFLYVNGKTKLSPFVHGGRQERGRRAGTENVPGIVGIAAAAERASLCMEERATVERRMRDYLIDRIEAEIPEARLTGHRTIRLPGHVSFCFKGIQGESALIMLDMQDICASSGSACTTGDPGPSHVLLAAGVPEEMAKGSIRFTLSAENTMEELDVTVEALAGIVEKLRGM